MSTPPTLHMGHGSLFIGATKIIGVKNGFTFFFILVTFLRFLTFHFPKVFILKNVGKVQNGKQINKKHFQNNSNETNL